MKKIIAVFLLLSIALSFIACNKAPAFKTMDDYGFFETRDIVLGNEVDSVVLTTKTGEKITFDNTAEFYEIFNKVGFAIEEGKRYSCSAEMKMDDEPKSLLNMNFYYGDDARFLEAAVKKDGDDNISLRKEYSVVSSNVKENAYWGQIIYKDEKWFKGVVTDENGIVSYYSDEKQIWPEEGTELNEMYNYSDRLVKLLNFIEFFEYQEPFISGDKIYDYNDGVTREYKLHENYIVFKQTAPFLSLVGSNEPAIKYAHSTDPNYSITQEAYCNVKTGEIELIRIYGSTRLHMVEYQGIEWEMNIQMYIHNIDSSEYQDKIDSLVDYVKSNAQKKSQ